MNKLISNFIRLVRLNNPIGIWLIYLPCLFSIALSAKYNFSANIFFVTILFFAGAITMRSAGCVINDILDRNFDKEVRRTKIRPLAAGEINIKQALILLLILLIVALIILTQFNLLTDLLGWLAFLLIILYPLTKRFTYYPQIFLGITFNYGILLASSAILNYIPLAVFSLYLSAIFWTIIYDTIYAYQDIEDDIKIGVKSTAIKFNNHPRRALYGLISLQFIFLLLTGLLAHLQFSYYLFILTACCHLICQVRTCNFDDQESCLQKFKSNLWVGVIILIGIISG